MLDWLTCVAFFENKNRIFFFYVNATVKRVDNTVKELLQKLEKKRLKNLANLIVVSYHGL